MKKYQVICGCGEILDATTVKEAREHVRIFLLACPISAKRAYVYQLVDIARIAQGKNTRHPVLPEPKDRS